MGATVSHSARAASVPNLLYIGGSWTAASDGGLIEVTDPATEEVIDTVPHATAHDLDRALEAAQQGFELWREVDAWQRTAALRTVARLIAERKEQIALVMTEEQGKPLREAIAEVGATAEYFDWFADEARRMYGRLIPASNRETRLLTMRQPVGPVAAFTAWNFPALLAARKIAAAVAAGCSVILKPTEEAPRTAFCLAQAFDDAEVPAGVLNVVTGDPPAISRHLLASDVIRKVSLTGSVPVGQELLRLSADGLKSTSMELGGHAPVLVFDDADIDQAVDICLQAKFRNAGQVCISPSRLFVRAPVVDAFTESFAAAAATLRLGDGRDPATDVGPLSNRRRLEGVQSLVDDAVSRGAVLRHGGHRAEAFDRGLFFEPTVLAEVDDAMRVMSEEPFGPIAPISSFDEVDEVVARANATPYGLAGYVFTRDLRTAFLVSEALEVGMVGVNNLVIARPEAPFGGVKRSGFGREGGSEGIDAYTVTKYVNVRL